MENKSEQVISIFNGERQKVVNFGKCLLEDLHVFGEVGAEVSLPAQLKVDLNFNLESGRVTILQAKPTGNLQNYGKNESMEAAMHQEGTAISIEEDDESPQPSQINLRELPLQHSDRCPARELRALLAQGPEAITQYESARPLSLSAVCFILDRERNLLLTKRSNLLQTFPNCWVAPGGRVDALRKLSQSQNSSARKTPTENFPHTSVDSNSAVFESLEQCAIREVREEVGIELKNLHLQPFFLWESVYPVDLTFGMPKSHSLIVFYVVLLEEYNSNIRLTLQAEEADLAAWVPLDKLEVLISENAHLQKQLNITAIEKETVQCNFILNLQGKKKDVKREVSLMLLKGRYPNALNEGLGEAHQKAVHAVAQFIKRKI